MGPTCSPRGFVRACAPAWRAPALWRRPLAGAAAALLVAAAHGADDFPPPLSPEAATPAAAAASPAAPAAAPPVAAPAAPAEEPAAVPPAAPKPQRDAQIEQRRVGPRVAEVVVTPAGFTYHYTMTHLDDQDIGTTPLQPHPELSIPRLFRIDFNF